MRRLSRPWILITVIVILTIGSYILIVNFNSPSVAYWPQAELPKTTAGQCAVEFFDAFNSDNSENLRSFYQKYRTKSYLENNPIEKSIGFFKRAFESLGLLTPIKMTYSTESEIIILCGGQRTDKLIQTRFIMYDDNPVHLKALTINPLFITKAEEYKLLDDQIIRSTIKSVAKILREQYVYPEKGEEIASALEQYYTEGRYAEYKDGAAFASKASDDLRAIGKDLHLGLCYGKAPEDKEMTRIEDKNAAGANYGFSKTEILPQNIGYIAIDMFHHSEEARDAAVRALKQVASCDALIFDIRFNAGGGPEIIGFIASYLFDKPTLLGSRYSRIHDEKHKEFYSYVDIPGKRFDDDIPIYILTSEFTCSAAEAFAICLQELKRGTVVGETTCGGAHTVIRSAVNDLFWMNIPYGRAIGPVSKNDWEGVGVVPDIKVSSDEALKAACEHASKLLKPMEH
jgi:hypothetical protein